MGAEGCRSMVGRTVGAAPSFDRARWHRECEARLALSEAVREATSDLAVQGGEIDLAAGYIQDKDSTGGVITWSVPLHDQRTQDGTRARVTLPADEEVRQARYASDPVELRQAGERMAYLSEHTQGTNNEGPNDSHLPPQYRRLRVMWTVTHLVTLPRAQRQREQAAKISATKRTTTPGATAADRKAVRDRRARERRALEAGVSLAQVESERARWAARRGQADDLDVLGFLASASSGWDQDH
jgi:hypothetical protein